MRQLREDIRSIDRATAATLLFATLMLISSQFFGSFDYWFRSEFLARRYSNYHERAFAAQQMWSIMTVVFFGLAPFCFSMLVLRLRPGEMGFKAKGLLRHLPVYALLYIVMVPLIVWASRQESFLNTYPFPILARTSSAYFWKWEVFYFLQFCALESFFRGFLLFPLERKFGQLAIFVMVIPYAMVHLHKPFPEALGAIVAGVLLGYMALRTRSFYGGILLHYAVALTMDLLAHIARGH